MQEAGYRPRQATGWRLVTAGGLALLLAGCSSLSAVDRQVGSLPEAPAKQVAEDVPPAAQREHQRILAAYGGAYQNAKLEALTAQTVARLVASSDRPDLHYRVTILNSQAVNAFALPTGHLYVTRGMLALANDTSELASVLSHEMAHVIAQHAAIREDLARREAIVSKVMTDVVSDPQIGALALARSKITLASFSRAQELEADALGVGLAARAGYDPYGASRFLTAMGRNADLRPTAPMGGGEVRPVDFLSSHPSTPDRVKSALSAARQKGAPGAGGRDRNTYLAALQGLPYGDDPGAGYVRGRRFVHPKLGFTVTVPQGFSLENTAQAVLGVKEGGSQAMRLDVVRVPAEQTLPDYLTSGWIERVDAGSVEPMTIGGFPAATALAKGEDWTFRLYVLRFGNDVYRFIFAAKTRNAETDRSFRDTVNSFRTLTQAEIDHVRPLRLQVVTVQPGEVAEQYAQRMATDRPLERFLMLNGLSVGQPLTPGESVKVVVE